MIRVQKLHKNLNGIEILHNISFNINSGEIVSYLGPNGAGKTTTIYIISTLLKPSLGTVSVNGYNIESDSKKIRKMIGCAFDDFGLYPGFSVVKNLDFIGSLYGITKKVRKERIIELIEFFDLKDYKKSFVAKLSKGTKQKVNLAKSLIHEPEILFLDEPTSGLDPFATKDILDLIRSMKDKGKTIFMTTHMLDLAESVSDKIIMINEGKIIYDGLVSGIRNNESIKTLKDLFFELIGDKNDCYN